MNHSLKIERPFYEAVKDGRKTFEIRFNDRGFNVGDTLELIQAHEGIANYSEILKTEITYVLSGWGLKEGFVAIGIRLLGDTE